MKREYKNDTFVSLECNYCFEELSVGDMFIMVGYENKGIFMKTATIMDGPEERNAIQLSTGRHWSIEEEESVAWVEKATIVCNNEELK